MGLWCVCGVVFVEGLVRVVVMGVEEWVRDLAITLRVLETSYPYNVFPIAKIVGQARALGLSLRKNKYVVRALCVNRVFFTARRVSRYRFFGLTRKGREYADMVLGTVMVPSSIHVVGSAPYRARLGVTYKYTMMNVVRKRTHNILVDVTFVRNDDEGENITEPIEANNIYGVIRVLDKGFEYENLDLYSLPRTSKPILNNYPILYCLFRYVITHPKESYKANQSLAKTLLYTLALRPQLLNAEATREYDTVIIRWGGRKICCECIDPEVCIHNI